MTYLYALIDPSTGHPYYVGKTASPEARLEQHTREKGGGHLDRANAAVLKKGLPLQMEILATCPDDYADELEWVFIMLFSLGDNSHGNQKKTQWNQHVA